MRTFILVVLATILGMFFYTEMVRPAVNDFRAIRQRDAEQRAAVERWERANAEYNAARAKLHEGEAWKADGYIFGKGGK